MTSDLLDRAVRAGMVAYGVVNLLIGWLAIKLAIGEHTGSPSKNGALKELASQPFGKALVWAVCVGMVLLVVWKVIEVVTGRDDKDGASEVGARIVDGAKALVYGSLAFTAFKVAQGQRSGGNTKTKTAELMSMPGGTILVAVIGLIVLGYGAQQIWTGATKGFTDKLDAEGTSGDTGKAYVAFGRVGHIARGIAFGIVGIMFVTAAVKHDPNSSGGLDQALGRVLEQPLGSVLLGLIGVGFGCYGLFCLARARHLSR